MEPAGGTLAWWGGGEVSPKFDVPPPAFPKPGKWVSQSLFFEKEAQDSGRVLEASYLLPKAGEVLTELWERGERTIGQSPHTSSPKPSDSLTCLWEGSRRPAAGMGVKCCRGPRPWATVGPCFRPPCPLILINERMGRTTQYNSVQHTSPANNMKPEAHHTGNWCQALNSFANKEITVLFCLNIREWCCQWKSFYNTRKGSFCFSAPISFTGLYSLFSKFELSMSIADHLAMQHTRHQSSKIMLYPINQSNFLKV